MKFYSKQILFLIVLISFSILSDESLYFIKLNNRNMPLKIIKTEDEISNTSILIQHDPIIILNNSAFGSAGYNFSGDGSIDNPFKIVNFNITNSNKLLIIIQDTSVHFDIVNCHLDGIDKGDGGILCINVTNGIIMNNNVQRCDYGIYLDHFSNNIIVLGNTINNNSGNGIDLEGKNNIIENNIIMNNANGIYIHTSTISHNKVSMNSLAFNSENGIYSFSSISDTITSNFIYNNTLNGLLIEQCNKQVVKNNQIYYNGQYGVGSYHSWENYLLSNDIYQQQTGFYIFNSQDEVIAHNSIYNNQYSGIIVYNVQNTIIFNNSIFYHNSEGIHLMDASQNIIINNTIHNSTYGNGIFVEFSSNNNVIAFNHISNTYDGIHVVFPLYTLIVKNIIHNCTRHGVLTVSSYTRVYNNLIYSNSLYGISLSGNNCDCYGNLVQENSDYGISIESASINKIQFNNFISNKNGNIQGFDEGQNSSFYSNYWNEWTSPDSDLNGFVDEGYFLDGFQMNYDTYPKTTPNDPYSFDYLTNTRIVYPSGNEIVSGNITMVWIPVFDFAGHTVYYDIHYSNDSINWFKLKENIESTEFTWDTTTVADGTTYLIRITAHCLKELNSVVISNSFSILNSRHILLPATIIYPLTGIFNGTIVVDWETAVDSHSHEILYDLNYSPDAGNTWITLIENISQTSFIWDTRTVNDGSQYMLQIITYCSEGLVTSTISTELFSISNVLTTNISTSEITSSSESSTGKETTTTNTITTTIITIINLTPIGFPSFLLFFIIISLIASKRKTH